MISSWANRSLYGQERALVDDRVDQLLHVERDVLAGGHDVLDRTVRGGLPAVGRRRLLLPGRREVRQPQPHGGDRLLVVFDEHVTDAGHAAVHLGAAHLLERDLLAGHHLGESGRAEVGGGVAADHDRDVAQRRDVGRPGRRRSEQGAHLGDPAGVGDLVVEDVAPRPATGVAVELLVDAGAGGVDEVHERCPDLVGELLHPGDLLERPAPPGAGLDGVVVGDDARRSPVDLADDGHHGVAGQPVVGPGEQAVFEVRLVVEQQAQAVADQQLALVGDPLPRLLRPAQAGGGGALAAARRPARPTVWIDSATFRRARRRASRWPS